MHCEKGAQVFGGPIPCLGSTVLLSVQCVLTIRAASLALSTVLWVVKG